MLISNNTVCIKKLNFEIQIICKMLYRFDSSECFELMIHKKTQGLARVWELYDIINFQCVEDVLFL